MDSPGIPPDELLDKPGIPPLAELKPGNPPLTGAAGIGAGIAAAGLTVGAANLVVVETGITGVTDGPEKAFDIALVLAVRAAELA